MTSETVDQAARLFRAGVLRGRESLGPYMPGLGWLDFDAGAGTEHVGLPSDLFNVSIHCDDGPTFEANVTAGLQVVISPVRTQARRFTVQGRSQVAVATLTPLGMLSAFGVDLRGLTDRPVPLDHLCGRAQERRLAFALNSARSLPLRVEAFGRWLEERILDRRGLSMPTQRVANAAMVFVEGNTQAPGVIDVAKEFAVTRRQLERDFRAYLGVSPAAYGRLVRFQRAAAAVANGQPLLHAAIDHGFADQSHMNRVFKELASVTPRELAREGARPGRQLVRAGMGGRVFLLDALNRSTLGESADQAC